MHICNRTHPTTQLLDFFNVMACCTLCKERGSKSGVMLEDEALSVASSFMNQHMIPNLEDTVVMTGNIL